MRRTRFDTRLIQVFTAMTALAVMVGAVAIAVNRYLVHSQDALIRTNLPAIELVNRIGSAAEVVGTLAVAFTQADTGADLDRIAAALEQAVDRIETGTRTLEDDAAAPPDAPRHRAGRIVGRMVQDGHARLRLTRQVAEAVDELARQGAQLDALIEAQTDLARLRITAGIVGLYRGESEAVRPALDRLADRDFFAFERVSELGGIVDGVRIRMQQVPEMTSGAEIAATRAAMAERLDLAARRAAFLPSRTARDALRDLLERYRTALAPGGLLDLQEERIAVVSSISADSALLQRAVVQLSERARRAREAAQTAGLAQIALAQRRASWMTIALVGVIAVAVVVASILWLYARRQLVARLANLSRRIIAVAGAEYGEPAPISGHDEIGRMEKALNILRRRAIDAARLRAHLEEAVIARTGDVVAEMKEADAARAKAEAADLSKTEFLARMSHEIRTPLNGIIGMLRLLRDEAGDPEWQDRVRTAHRSARELLEITNDILDYTSSEDRSNGGNPVHFMLRDFVGQLAHQLHSLAADKDLEVSVDLSETAPLALYGDVVRIRQIVGNLISNAVKYTHRGRVTLIVDHALCPETRNPVLSFTVADTGIGMTPEAVSHAFDAYSRADMARRAGTEGVGLGLAISRNLTRALGGVLSVESEPGVGSRFTLTVPMEMGDPALIGDDSDDWPTEMAGRDVLIIDDHAVNRLVARGYLERMGCRVQEAATGTAGLTAQAAERFDLILIDLDLPDLPGAEVARRIGARDDSPELVALTAHLIEDTPENRERIGVVRILAKPISPRKLAEVLASAGPGEGQGQATSVRNALAGDMRDMGAETTARIVEEFLRDLPEGVAALRAPSGEARRKAAHRLRGAAANFGLGQLCAALGAVESAEAQDVTMIAQAERLAEDAARQLREAAAHVGLQLAAGSTKR